MSETMVEYETKSDINKEFSMLERCKNLKIITAEDFAVSAEWYAICNNEIKTINTRTEKLIAEAHQLHKSLCKERNDALVPWEDALRIISSERNRYQVEKNKIDLERQKKAEAVEAEKKEKERQKLLEQAIKLEEKGKVEQAEAKLNQAENICPEPVFVPPTVEKKVELSFGGSVSSKQDFDVVVTDIKAICKAVVDSKLPTGIIEIKNSALKTFCKLNQIKNGDIEGLLIKTKFRDINRK